MINRKQKELLFSMVNQALDQLYDNDFYLIEYKVHERSIVSRFFIYLQTLLNETEFSVFNLDFEYNKNHSDPKRTVNFPKGAYPDLILHRRGSNDKNILLIEFKTWWHQKTDIDIKKIKNFTARDGRYKYPLGLSIVLNRERSEVNVMPFMNGEVGNE